MENVAILIQLLVSLLGQADKIAKLLNAARSEGRDVSEEELATLFTEDDAARARLQALIDARDA